MNSLWCGLAFALFSLSSVTCTNWNYRLDTRVIPDAYDITVKPYLLPEDAARQFTFDGEVLIRLKAIAAEVRSITLHKNNIAIKEAQLYDGTNKLLQTFSVEELTYENATHKLTANLRQTLRVNVSYVLYFSYTGRIRADLGGFYRINYTDASGRINWIAATQLQRIEARTVFPCFDEPALKATFRMHISRPKHYNSKFNTQLVLSSPDGVDRHMDHFAETPPMSTYLVAFIVSNFIELGNEEIVLITRPDFYSKTDFSFSVAKRLLAAYNEYTKLPYERLGNPLMQLASLPRFPHNGMENWGLIMYKDAVLIHEPSCTDGWHNKQYTISILAHETSHMWFGNSVTFAWWSYFWLNEAFARYYQYFMAHELYPEYQLDQQFVVNQVQTILLTDAVNTTQPLTSPEASIRTPNEIESKFSAITYAKGACIVRMIRNIMGHARFDEAIRDYLKQNHLGTTIPADLFMHLKRHWPAGHAVNLDEFFHDWTEQVGYPVLSVNVSADGQLITLSQKRFLLSPANGSDAQLRYTLPITFTSNTERDFNHLSPRLYYNKSQNVLTVSLHKPVKWVIFNLQQSNYYRVLYDAATLTNIRRALMAPQQSGIHVINRAQLVDDLFNYGRVGLLDYDVVFEFMKYLSFETEYLPWYAAFTGFQLVSQRFTLEQQKFFGNFLLDIADNVYTRLGFTNRNDSVLDVFNRNQVISWLCRYGHRDCIKRARLGFSNIATGGKKPSPDFREVFYCCAVRRAENIQSNDAAATYAKLQKWYSEQQLASEKEMLLRAMGCTRRHVNWHYAFILSNTVPREHKFHALKAIYKQNPENVTPMFLLIKDTFERLADALGSWSTTADVISDISNYFTTKEQKQLLGEFIAEKSAHFGASVLKLHEAIEKVEKNLIWAENHLGKLVNYLENRMND